MKLKWRSSVATGSSKSQQLRGYINKQPQSPARTLTNPRFPRWKNKYLPHTLLSSARVKVGRTIKLRMAIWLQVSPTCPKLSWFQGLRFCREKSKLRRRRMTPNSQREMHWCSLTSSSYSGSMNRRSRERSKDCWLKGSLQPITKAVHLRLRRMYSLDVDVNKWRRKKRWMKVSSERKMKRR